MFLDHINIKSPPIEENCNLFYELIEKESGKDKMENELLKFLCKIKELKEMKFPYDK